MSAEALEKQFEATFCAIKIKGTDDNILDTGIVYRCLVNDDFAKITLILPENSDLRAYIPQQVEEGIRKISTIHRVVVELLDEEPPEEATHQEPSPQSPQEPKRTSYLTNYDTILVVASGKGGVGKSTVALNLALALSQKGHSVSLLDADIYGPSLPIMAGLRGQRPEIHENRMIPIEVHGIHTLSIGYLVEENSSMIWRGPMVHQVIDQLLRETIWPGGDFMIIDLPPGTGDAQLTLSQLCEISGAVIVSTPQDVALLDAIKAIHMFSKVDIEVVGIVENMSSFVCPHCEKETAIFSSNGAQRTSENFKVPFLGRIPLELSIRESGDQGKPIMAEKESSIAQKAFQEIATNVLSSLKSME